MRRAADPQIRQAFPIDDVVSAYSSRLGVVGYLVARIAARPRQPFGDVVHLAERVLIRQRRARTRLGLRIEGRSFLQNEAVTAQVLRRQRNRLAQRPRPLLRRLPRQAEHQIQVQVVKARRPRHGDGRLRLLARVDAPDISQKPVVKALHPQRQPVDARRPVAFQIFPRQRAGVALHRDFRVRRQRKAASERIQHAPDLRAGHQRGRSPAEKHRLHPPRAEKGRLLAHFAADGLGIRFPLLHPPAEGREIAISAFFDAHRDVNIDRNRFHIVSLVLLFHLFGSSYSSIFSTAMNASLGTCTLPSWRMRFLPSFCFSSSLRLRLMSPP